MSDILSSLKPLFGEVFSDLFPQGVLHKSTLVDNGKGGWTSTQIDHPISVMIEDVSREMRTDPNYTDQDVALIILDHGLPDNTTVNEDDRVTDGFGVVWSLKVPIRRDPIRAAWMVKGEAYSG